MKSEHWAKDKIGIAAHKVRSDCDLKYMTS